MWESQAFPQSLPFQSWLSPIWKGRWTLIERLYFILRAKVGSGLRDNCRGEWLCAGMDGSSRLELRVQPVPWNAGEAEGRHNREVTAGWKEEWDTDMEIGARRNLGCTSLIGRRVLNQFICVHWDKPGNLCSLWPQPIPFAMSWQGFYVDPNEH